MKHEWVIHAKSRLHKMRIEFAMESIHEAAKTGKFCVSWSTGKDSTALCHLVKSLYPKTPIIIQFDDCDWPEKESYAERVASTHGWVYHRVEPGFSVWESARKGNIGFEEFCAQSHDLTADSFIKPLQAKQDEIECDGVYLGLRSEEGRARKMNLGSRGELYKKKDGRWVCCPLGRWSTLDVFAYLTENNIEINPCYFNNRIRQPEDIRLSWALPTPSGIRYGDMEHMRIYYPKQYQKLRNEGVV